LPFYSSSSLSFSNPGVGAEAPEFASLYEAFNPLTTEAKTHFVEWFSGDVLDSIWTKANIAGTNTFQMVDSIDEGFEIITVGGSGTHGGLTFNNKRHYDPNDCVAIFVNRAVSTTAREIRTGFAETTFLNQFILQTNDTIDTNHELKYDNATTQTDVATDIAVDETFHVHKLESTTSNIKLFIDGVDKATGTTDLPTVKMQPFFSVKSAEAVSKTGRIRYYEAYSTA